MTEHFGEEIKRLCKEKRISIEYLSDKIGFSRIGIYAIFKRKDINTELLRKISNVLKLPMSYWFEYDKEKKFETFYYMDSDECGAKLAQAQKEIKLLKDELALKDDLIMSQKKLISVLEKNNK